MKEFLMDVDWAGWFFIISTLAMVLCVGRGKREWEKFSVEIKRDGIPPSLFLELASRYLKRNPFSRYSSHVHLFCVPIFLSNEEREEAMRRLKKVRIVDLDLSFDSFVTDYLLYVLFLLKECAYTKEYEYFKAKAEKSAVIRNHPLYQLLLKEDITFQQIPDEICEDRIFFNGLVIYYRGVAFFQNQEKNEAKEQFELLKKMFPYLSTMLESKGYLE